MKTKLILVSLFISLLCACSNSDSQDISNDFVAKSNSIDNYELNIEKLNAVTGNRKLMGATDPQKAEEGTLRKKYGISIDKNSVHGSDSVENAKIEINFFFKD